MPTIRDVVRTLTRRDGVDAVVVLGRDGLLIDAAPANGLDADGVAALVPPVVAACNHLGRASGRGAFGVGLVEFEGGLVLLSELSAEALLAIVVRPGVNVGGLLFELRQHREAIAALL
jgi:predicted regulator of Ras-like GTPase activity (Roadblock/LC7/MglB family)